MMNEMETARRARLSISWYIWKEWCASFSRRFCGIQDFKDHLLQWRPLNLVMSPFATVDWNFALNTICIISTHSAHHWAISEVVVLTSEQTEAPWTKTQDSILYRIESQNEIRETRKGSVLSIRKTQRGEGGKSNKEQQRTSKNIKEQ